MKTTGLTVKSNNFLLIVFGLANPEDCRRHNLKKNNAEEVRGDKKLGMDILFQDQDEFYQNLSWKLFVRHDFKTSEF